MQITTLILILATVWIAAGLPHSHSPRSHHRHMHLHGRETSHHRDNSVVLKRKDLGQDIETDEPDPLPSPAANDIEDNSKKIRRSVGNGFEADDKIEEAKAVARSRMERGKWRTGEGHDDADAGDEVMKKMEKYLATLTTQVSKDIIDWKFR